MFIAGVAIILLANIGSAILILKKRDIFKAIFILKKVEKGDIFKAIPTVAMAIINIIASICFWYELAETEIVLGYYTIIPICVLLLELILLFIFSKPFFEGQLMFAAFFLTLLALVILYNAWGTSFLWQDDPYEHSIIIKDIEGTDELFNILVQIVINCYK